MRKIFYLCFVSLAVFSISCGQRYLTPGTVTKYDDKFSDTDLRTVAERMASSITIMPEIKDAEKPPTIVLLHIRNETMEHINTDAIGDKIMVALTKTGNVRFVNRDILHEIAREQELLLSKAINLEDASKVCRLVGAKYFIDGELTSIEKKAITSNLTWYRFSLKLTSVETGIIIWADETEIKKQYVKTIFEW